MERVLKVFEIEREMRMTKKVPDPIKSSTSLMGRFEASNDEE